MRKLVLMLFLAILPSFAWYGDFPYVNTANVSIVSNQTNYVGFGTIPYSANMDTTDFTGIVVTDASDNLIDFCVARYDDSVSADIFVYGNFTTVNQPEVSVYYGNGSTVDYSDCSFFDYFINFTSSTGWTLGSGWSISNGYLVAASVGAYSYLTSIPTYDDVSVFSRVCMSNNDNYPTIQIHWDADNDRWYSMIRQPDSTQALYSQTSTLEDSYVGDYVDGCYNFWLADYGTNVTSWTNGLMRMDSQSAVSTDAGQNRIWSVGTNASYDYYAVWTGWKGFIGNLTFNGEVSNITGITLSANTTTPFIYDFVNFTVTENSVSITDYWWNFTDGNETFHTTEAGSIHLFDTLNSHNVSVIGTDGASNYTSSLIINVVQGNTTIWLQDSLTGLLIQNFTIYSNNVTSTYNASTTNYYVLWNFTDALSGNVSIYAEASFYNTTSSEYTINASSLLNITISASPAVLIIRPRDATYPQLVVPAAIDLYNISTTFNDYAALDSVLSTGSVSASGISGSDTEITGLYYEQAIDYSLSATTTNTEAGDTAYAKLYIRDEENNTQIIDWVNRTGSGTGSTTIASRRLYLSQLGYEIRESDGTLVTSSTNILSNYPFRVYIESLVTTNDAGETATVTWSMSGPTDEYSFYIPSGAPTGTTRVTASQYTGSPFSFLETSYYNQILTFDLNIYSLINYTIYMYQTLSGVQQTVYVIDDASDPVESVFVQAYGAINDTSQLISSQYTDGSGRTYIYLEAGTAYTVTASKSGYTPKTVNLLASDSAVYITLSQAESAYTSPYSSVTYGIDLDTPLITNSSYTVNYSIADTETTLSNFSLSVYLDGSLLSTQTGTTSGGGALSYTFNVTATTGFYTIKTDFWKTSNGTLYYFNFSADYPILQLGWVDKFIVVTCGMDSLSKTMWGFIINAGAFLISPYVVFISLALSWKACLITEGIVILGFLGNIYLITRRNGL